MTSFSLTSKLLLIGAFGVQFRNDKIEYETLHNKSNNLLESEC